jgi:hypothetical protein
MIVPNTGRNLLRTYDIFGLASCLHLWPQCLVAAQHRDAHVDKPVDGGPLRRRTPARTIRTQRNGAAATKATVRGTTGDHRRPLPRPAAKPDHEVMARTTARAICTSPRHDLSRRHDDQDSRRRPERRPSAGIRRCHRLRPTRGQPSQDHRTSVRVTDVSRPSKMDIEQPLYPRLQPHGDGRRITGGNTCLTPL